MKKKELYEAPVVEAYDLVPEGRILVPSNPNETTSDSSSSGYDPNYDLGLI